MTTIQKLHLTFKDGSKRAIIIEKYMSNYMAMICEDGFYGTYSYILENEKPKLFNTAIEIAQKYIGIWSAKSELTKIESTNEFIKTDELKSYYPQAEIMHV